MKTRAKSTAIIMALIITLSVFTSVAATAAVATTTPTVAAATTTTTITASPTNPAVGQSVTFTVNLIANGKGGLDKKPVKLWCTVNGGKPIVRGTFNTINGVITFAGPFSTKGQVIYHAEFTGDSQYASSAGSVTVNVGTTPTTTTITASDPSPYVGQSVKFTVTLKSGSSLLEGKTVKLWCTINNGPRIDRQGTFTTDKNGVVTFEGPLSVKGQVIYHAEFAGDSKYAGSSGTVTVNVGTTATTTTI
jgi:hypothetical protein